MPDSLIRPLEQSIAAYLDKKLPQVAVRLWADVFGGAAPQSRSLICVGHSRSESETISKIPYSWKETATFEIRVECVDLRDHQKAMGIMESAIGLLAGVQWFQEWEAIAPVSYGVEGYRADAKIWSYTGTVTSSIARPCDALTPIEEIPTDSLRVVSVGLWNSYGLPGNENDRVIALDEWN